MTIAAAAIKAAPGSREPSSSRTMLAPETQWPRTSGPATGWVGCQRHRLALGGRTDRLSAGAQDLPEEERGDDCAMIAPRHQPALSQARRRAASTSADTNNTGSSTLSTCSRVGTASASALRGMRPAHLCDVELYCGVSVMAGIVMGHPRELEASLADAAQAASCGECGATTGAPRCQPASFPVTTQIVPTRGSARPRAPDEGNAVGPQPTLSSDCRARVRHPA